MSHALYVSEPFTFPGGGAAADVPVWVYHRGTTVRAPIYWNSSDTAKMNPVKTDASGRATFWAEPGQYDLEAHGVRFPVIVGSPPPSGGESAPGPPGPKGDKGDKGDSVTAGVGRPPCIIPGVSTFIDANSGDVYVYEED
jgi:hypothetical protein